MATTDDAPAGVCERCDDCGRETLHRVSVQMRTDDANEGPGFSREPYRVTECRRCGERSSRPLGP